MPVSPYVVLHSGGGEILLAPGRNGQSFSEVAKYPFPYFLLGGYFVFEDLTVPFFPYVPDQEALNYLLVYSEGCWSKDCPSSC